MKLILLPGLDGTGQLLAVFRAALAGFDTQAIAYLPDRAMNYSEHEAFARDQLPLDEDYVLLAESFSGPIGISIAAAAPPRLKGLVLCGTFVANPFRFLAPLRRLIGALPAVRIPPAFMAPLLYAGRGTPELRRAYAQVMTEVSPAAIQARFAAILAVDYSPLLRGIEVPMMYLRATADRLISIGAWHAIQKLRPDVELTEIDAPHFLLQTEPQACAAAVMGFIHRRTITPPR